MERACDHDCVVYQVNDLSTFCENSISVANFVNLPGNVKFSTVFQNLRDIAPIESTGLAINGSYQSLKRFQALAVIAFVLEQPAVHLGLVIPTVEATSIIFAVGRCLYKLVKSFLSPINPLLVHHQLIETAVLERVIKKLLKAGIQPIEGFLQPQHELGLVSFHGLICF